MQCCNNEMQYKETLATSTGNVTCTDKGVVKAGDALYRVHPNFTEKVDIYWCSLCNSTRTHRGGIHYNKWLTNE